MAKRLRVLHVIGAKNAGGAELFAVRLLSAMAKQAGFEVAAVVRKNSWVGRQLKGCGVKLFEAEFGGFWDVVKGRFGRGTKARVQEIADTWKPDVAMAWMNRGAVFMPRGNFARVGRLGGFYDLKYYRGHVEHLVGNTAAICDYCVREGWDAGKVTHVTNFVPLPVSGWRAERIALRKKLGFATRDTVLAVVGRLHRVKGVDVAIAALARLPEDVKLMVVGEGPERAALETLATELKVAGRVRFVGWADDVSGIAAAADMWLVPSRHEPLGNTVLDAWVHKIPVIATNTGGLAMLVKDGESGLVVAVDHEAELADAVMKLRRSAALAARVVKGGMERYGAEFSQTSVMKAFGAFFKRVADERQGKETV